VLLPQPQAPVAGRHTGCSGCPQTTGLPLWQAPAWHVSVCVHASPSLHAAPSAFAGSEQTPVPGSQVPASWHGSLAVQITGSAPVHVPAWHVSVRVHALPSLHAAPSGFAGLEQVPEVGSHVPASWH
jgi:hypothetical protein